MRNSKRMINVFVNLVNNPGTIPIPIDLILWRYKRFHYCEDIFHFVVRKLQAKKKEKKIEE